MSKDTIDFIKYVFFFFFIKLLIQKSYTYNKTYNKIFYLKKNKHQGNRS